MKARNRKLHTDEQLVTLVQQGDRQAMGELYSRYYSLVYHKCLSFAQYADDARDLAQDVMLKVLDKISSFKGQAKFSTWLYAITFNHCIDQKRKNKKVSFESLNKLASHTYLARLVYIETMEDDIKPDIAGKALTAISEEDLNLLLMKYQFNKSIAELQSAYNLSASAVKMRLLRARAKASDSYSRMITSHAA